MFAQKADPGAPSKPREANPWREGFEGAGYRIHQAIELGYRVTDTTGSNAMYETLVDLHTGPCWSRASRCKQSSTKACFSTTCR